MLTIKTTLAFPIGFLLLSVTCTASPECADGVCPLPEENGETAQAAVFMTLPASAIQPIVQAPRLKSLDGKTIALVGGSFMASVTHPELKRLILEEFPTAKIYLLREIGSAGPYPRPGTIRPEKDEFQRRLKEFKVDAVVSGNGGCGLCTPKETGSCIAAEVLGLPSVMIAGPGFVRQAKNTALAAGVSVQRVAEYPGAFASHTREELIENTRKVLYPAIKKALTEPIAPDERTLGGEWQSDGLPTVPPTEELVAEFLRFPDLSADHKLGAIPPAMRDVTVRHVAMIGARAYANYWGNPGSAFDPQTCPLAQHEKRIACEEGARQTVTPPWLAWTGHETIDAVPTMQTGKNIFLVTGDPARNKELCLPGGGSATIRIVLPAAWNTLMAERGYAPLDSYKLTSDLKPDTPRQKVRGDRRWRF